MMVERLFLVVPQGCLQFVIVVFPDHTHLLFLSGAYNHPSMSDELFEQDCTLGLDKISEKYEHFILLGDLNFNMLNGPKSEKLTGVCDIFD